MRKQKKKRQKTKTSFRKKYSANLPFPSNKKAYFALAFFAFLLLFSLNFSTIQKYSQYIIHTVHAADLAAIVASSGSEINLSPGSYTFSGDLTIPSTKTLHFERGAVITIGSGQALFVNGGMDDPLYQIFQDNSGDLGKGVKFSNGNILNVRPEWWGGVTTGSQAATEVNNIDKGIELAIHSHRDFKTTVIFTNGVYHISKPIILIGSTSLKGQAGSGGWNSGTVIRPKNGISNINLLEDSAPISPDQSSEISQITFGGAYTTNNAINLTHGTSNWNIHDSGTLETVTGWSVYMTNVSNVKMENNFFYSGGGDPNALHCTGEIYASGNNIQINFNEIPTSAQYGVFLENCQNCKLNGNIIFGDGSDYWSLGQNYFAKAIYAKNSPNISVTGNRTDNWDIGILIDNSPGIYKYNSQIGDFVQGIRVENNLSGVEISKNYISRSGTINPWGVGNIIFKNDPSWKQFFVDPNAKQLVFRDNFLDLWNAAVSAGVIDSTKLNNLKYFWEKYAKEPNDNGYGIALFGNYGSSNVISDNTFDSNFGGTILFKASSGSGNYSLVKYNIGLDQSSDLPILPSASKPEVAISDKWQTQNSSPVAISDFAKGFSGKEILVMFEDNNTTIQFSGATNLHGHGGADWNPQRGDHMRCQNQSSGWLCQCFDNTP